MPFGKGRRKLIWVGGLLLIGFAALWLSVPVWFPWVLRPLAARVGAHYSGYERLSYFRFSISELAVTNESFIVHAHRLEAIVPSLWLWKLGSGRSAGSSPFLDLDYWDCELRPSADTNTSPAYAQLRDAVDTLSTVKRWVPRATLSRGNVRSGKSVFAIPSATWVEGHVHARIQLPPEASGEVVDASLTPAHPYDLQLDLPALKAESTVTLSTNLSGFDLQSSTLWQSNRLELQAHFGPKDTLPGSATLRARDCQLPAERLGLPQYRQLTGSLLAQWEQRRFSLELSASAQSAENQTNHPPITVDLHAVGDTTSATIDKLVIHLPFAEATLSNTASLTFAAPFLHGPAHLQLTANLAQQPRLALTGRVAGTIAISTTNNNRPEASLLLAGSDVGNDYLKASSVEVSARFKWPWLELTRAEARFEGGSTAALSGRIDLEKKSAADGRFQFSGTLAQRWLPSGYSCGNASISGTFAGPFDQLTHTGQVEVDRVTTPMLQPLRLSGKWDGQAAALQHFELALAATNSSISLAGSLRTGPQRVELQLASFSLDTNHLPALKLAEPVNVGFALKSVKEWQLDLSRFHWAGPGGELDAQGSVQWPGQGAFRLSVTNLASKLLYGFSKEPLPELTIRQMSAYGAWSNGPASLGLDFSGTGLANLKESQLHQDASKTLPAPDAATERSLSPEVAAGELLSTPLNVELKLTGDERGLVLSNLVVSSPTSEVVVARGFLPLNLTPGASSNLVNINSEQPLVLNAAVRPEAFFWEKLYQVTGVRLDQPNLNLDLSGTWKAPQGQVTFRARGIQMHQAKSEQLSLQDLRLSLALERDQVRLKEGQLLVQGQRVGFSGQLPMGESAWMDLAHKKLPDWKQAGATLRVQDAQLAAFEPLFPEILAPQGELDLNLTLLPGQRLEGALNLRQARTRPLGNTAPFRDINATLRFQDRVLALENARASLSGAQIDLTGKVDLRGTNWLGGELPPFELRLRGANVPLAREAEYIIRSDLDLTISRTNQAAPLVYGTAHLRDSYYLSDLSALIPGGVAKPSARPPYFSIDNPALADWRLAVTVDGAHWLRVRTSLFNGEISANLHLQGTLGDPIALGAVKIDSGLVRFPFGNLDVQQGLVTLSSQDPYHPQLLVRAASKQFGYDIRMEVSGPVDGPVIQFTSNPALSSEQILLMLTAGQLPQATYTLTPQQRAQTVALFLGKDLLSKLGLSDQTQERLTIRSGEEISEQGRPTYHVQYRLTARWFVVGEYDRFGDFNGGFKWRIYSK